jgi:hypothetical protein
MTDFRRPMDIPAGITPVTTYRTSDGDVFADLHDAIEHQGELDDYAEAAEFLKSRPDAKNKPPAKLLAELIAWKRGRG